MNRLVIYGNALSLDEPTTVFRFNPFQAPELDECPISPEELTPGQVVAVETDYFASRSPETTFAAPFVSLGINEMLQSAVLLDDHADIHRLDLTTDLRVFDLGAEVTLTPLSRDRALSILGIISLKRSTDPLCNGLQSVALHYAVPNAVDLRQFS